MPAACPSVLASGSPKRSAKSRPEPADLLEQPPGRRRVRPVSHEDVGESRGVLAEEARDAHPEPPLHEERQRAGEPVPLARDVNREAAAVGVVAPPLDQPAVQEEWARPAHRRDQSVPLVPERGELRRLGDRADGRRHDPSRR